MLNKMSSIAGHFVLVFLSLTSIHCQSDDVKSLVYSLQERFCGTSFCGRTEQDPPLICRDDKEDSLFVLAPDVDTNMTSSANESSEFEKLSPRKCDACAPCSCEDDCEMYGTCCANKHIGSRFYVNCESVYLYNSRDVTIASEVILMVTKCARHAPNYSLNLAEKCEMNKVKHGNLVMSQNADHTHFFRNRHCAECYNITDYTSPGVYLGCDETPADMTNYTDLNSMISELTKGDLCRIGYEFPTSLALPICGRMETIDKCNLTGKWQEYNETVEEACHTYFNPIEYTHYRNIFCYLCNGEPEDQLECPPYCHGWTMFAMIMFPFSARLNFDRSDIEIVKGGDGLYKIQRIGRQTSRQCRDGDIYDRQSKKCRELYCPFASKKNTSSCFQLVSSESLVLTEWRVTAFIKREVIIQLDDIPFLIGSPVIKDLGTNLKTYGFAMNFASANDYATTRPPLTLVLSESHIMFKLFLWPGNDLETARSNLSKVQEFVLKKTLGGEPTDIVIVPHSGPWDVQRKLLVSPHIEARMDPEMFILLSSTSYTIPLKFNASCPMVRYQYQEVEDRGNSKVIHGNYVLDDTEYAKVIAEDPDSDYFICVEASMRERRVERVKDTDGEADEDKTSSPQGGIVLNGSPCLCLWKTMMFVSFCTGLAAFVSAF